MGEQDWLAKRFEENRGHLKAVAYRMLGSVNEADDAVQETWLRLSHSSDSTVANLRAWLTTVVARICLDMLRSRQARREEPLEAHVPDPIVSRYSGPDPEQETLLADSVGLALLVVLETLEPAERLAFVLHDMFSVPFDDLAGILGRSPAAARQLASRARRRVQGTAPVPDTDISRQREVVNAFLAASRNGDFEALLAVLDPDVVLRADAGLLQAGVSKVVRSATTVAEQALLFSKLAQHSRLAIVNGTPGLVTAPGGQPYSVVGFTIRHGKIVEIDILADPERLQQLNLSVVTE
jgi:RNA polymerase sigma-70 factor (ECF subfamily)